MLFSAGKYTYELVDGWAKLPAGWSFEEAPDLFIDSQDRVYVLSRSDHPIMVFDREGNFLKSLGEGLFSSRPHGICVGPDGAVYCVDDGNHTVLKLSPDGKLLMTLGNKGQPSDTGFVDIIEGPGRGVTRGSTLSEFTKRVATIKRGGPPFNRPTGVALSSSGEIYVTDGYGNARVHKFSPNGKLLFSWGEPGTAPGQFQIPHGIWVDKQDRVWVSERFGKRIQIFNAEGKFLSQWATFDGQVSNLCIDKNEETVFVAECKTHRRVSLFTIDGKLLGRWGGEGKGEAVLFASPHGIAVDSHGDLYIGEITKLQGYKDYEGNRAVRKLIKKT